MAAPAASNGVAGAHALDGGPFYSPLVRSIAKAEGVAEAELDAILAVAKTDG